MSLSNRGSDFGSSLKVLIEELRRTRLRKKEKGPLSEENKKKQEELLIKASEKMHELEVKAQLVNIEFMLTDIDVILGPPKKKFNKDDAIKDIDYVISEADKLIAASRNKVEAQTFAQQLMLISVDDNPSAKPTVTTNNYKRLLTELGILLFAFALNKTGDFGKQYGVLLIAAVYFGTAYREELKPIFAALFQPSVDLKNDETKPYLNRA